MPKVKKDLGWSVIEIKTQYLLVLAEGISSSMRDFIKPFFDFEAFNV